MRRRRLPYIPKINKMGGVSPRRKKNDTPAPLIPARSGRSGAFPRPPLSYCRLVWLSSSCCLARSRMRACMCMCVHPPATQKAPRRPPRPQPPRHTHHTRTHTQTHTHRQTPYTHVFKKSFFPVAGLSDFSADLVPPTHRHEHTHVSYCIVSSPLFPLSHLYLLPTRLASLLLLAWPLSHL